MTKRWRAWLPKFGAVVVEAHDRDEAARLILEKIGVTIRCACEECTREFNEQYPTRGAAR